MRRRAGGDSTRPDWLRRYDPADWSPAACHPECAFWAAVERWYAEHPDEPHTVAELVDAPDAPWHPEWI